MSGLRVHRLGYALGAEIRGVDLGNLDDATVAAIRKAWLEQVVLCIPGQDLGPEEMMAFCRRFGELDDHRASTENQHPEYPSVKVVSNIPLVLEGTGYKGTRTGRRWHSDNSYTVRPAAGTFLNAKAIPDVGGDTMFANMYLAYETLSKPLQRLLEGLEGVHDQALSSNYRMKSPAEQAAARRRNRPVVHPAVRVHPETGRKALFVNPRVQHFVGMTAEESKPLLDYLNGHARRYEFLYRHRWTLHDVVMWDNRCATHIAIQDYDQSQMRRMLRCTGLGPETGRIFHEEEELAPAPAATVSLRAGG